MGFIKPFLFKVQNKYDPVLNQVIFK